MTYTPAPPKEMLAYTNYNPGSGTTTATNSTTWVDVDATNLTITFTAPDSGKVLVRLSALTQKTVHTGATPYFWAVREGSTHIASGRCAQILDTTTRLTTHIPLVVTGLTPGQSYTYKWSHRVNADTQGMFYGGDTNTGSGAGPAVMEVWALP